jgi:hypothetical protein
MPAFNTRKMARIFRAPGWDEGETVTLKPAFTAEMFARVQARSNTMPQDVRAKLMTMEEEERQAAAQEYSDAGLWNSAVVAEFVASWTLRDAPTDAQTARGDPGDIAPLTWEMVRALPQGYAGPIIEEASKAGLEEIVKEMAVTDEATPLGATFPSAAPVIVQEQAPAPGGEIGAGSPAGLPAGVRSALDAGPDRPGAPDAGAAPAAPTAV